MFVDDLDALLRQQVPEIAAGVLEEVIAAKMGSETSFVLLSWKTIHKQLTRHADIRQWDYVVLPNMIKNGLVVQQYDQPSRINIFFRTTDHAYVTTVKTTEDGRRLYISRFHRARSKTPRSLLRRGPILRNHK